MTRPSGFRGKDAVVAGDEFHRVWSRGEDSLTDRITARKGIIKTPGISGANDASCCNYERGRLGRQKQKSRDGRDGKDPRQEDRETIDARLS